ncbi:MAG: Omp28-related outer membrane protein [Bacteroidia bacterium]
MKKTITKNVTLMAAALLLQVTLNAQSFKFPVFEHFTQASCAPCAAQNPGFQSSILNANSVTVHHIAYHTSWPGFDPMYNLNPTDPTDRVGYYNVTGVPSVTLMGNAKTGGPGSFSQADVDAQIAATSPLKVTVTEVDNGNNRDITVTLTAVGTMPTTGSYVLQTAVVERNVNYTSAPGTNGEIYFPNVLRKLVPDAYGTAVTLPATGTSVTYNLNVVEDATWNNSEIAVIAFVQDDVSKEILNSGASWDPQVNATLVAPPVLSLAGSSGNTSTFSATLGNSSLSSEDFMLTLTSVNAPPTWTANYSANGTVYTNPATVTVAAGSTIPTSINVTPDAAIGLGQYTLTITSVTNPGAPAMFYSVYVISGVTTILINNSSGLGDGSGGSAANWESDYTDGLNYANCISYVVTNDLVAARIAADNALTGVTKIFYNVGWTFPGLTDNLVNQLTTFLDNGGRLFIAGQDIGWEQFDVANSPYFTPTCQAFYNNYLNATWLNDGTTAPNVAFNLNTADAVFGTVPATTILNYYGSGTAGPYFYPDEMSATGTGSVICYYGAGTAKKGGVRSYNGTYKTVYLGVGIEMLSSVATKNEIIKMSYDWFDNLLSVEDFDAQMLNLNLGQNYPNPGNDVTSIPVSNLKEDATLQVSDVTGRIVMEQKVSKLSEKISLNTKNLEAGTYTYRLVSDSKITDAKVMQVIK